MGRIVYAEKAEAEANKDALLFNCAQRRFSTIIIVPQGVSPAAQVLIKTLSSIFLVFGQR
jgi:hypothetical protein